MQCYLMLYMTIWCYGKCDQDGDKLTLPNLISFWKSIPIHLILLLFDFTMRINFPIVCMIRHDCIAYHHVYGYVFITLVFPGQFYHLYRVIQILLFGYAWKFLCTFSHVQVYTNIRVVYYIRMCAVRDWQNPFKK